MSDVEDTLRRLQSKAVHLVKAPEKGGFSRLGGAPQLPATLTWPRWQDQPLAFIAQIALTELPGAHAPGWLFFFYNQDQSTWGFDPKDKGSWQVLYTDQAPPDIPRAVPPDVEQHSRFRSKPLAFREIVLPPGLERAGVPADHADYDALFDTYLETLDAAYGDEPRHQWGGYPFVIQNDDMELEAQLVSNGLYCGNSSGYNDPRASDLRAGASDWQLLLQVDSDDDTDMMWGDSGCLYFWIRSDDLQNRHFENVWMILQCC